MSEPHQNSNIEPQGKNCHGSLCFYFDASFLRTFRHDLSCRSSRLGIWNRMRRTPSQQTQLSYYQPAQPPPLRLPLEQYRLSLQQSLPSSSQLVSISFYSCRYSLSGIIAVEDRSEQHQPDPLGHFSYLHLVWTAVPCTLAISHTIKVFLVEEFLARGRGYCGPSNASKSSRNAEDT